MAADINDKLTAVRSGSSNAPVTTVATARSIGGTSLACNDLTGWPDNTESAIHFQTYKKKADGTKDFTTAVDMKGIVSGNTIGSIVIENGTDAGNDVDDFVEMAPTGAYAQDLYDGLSQTLNNDGTLQNNIVTTAKLADGAVTTAKLDNSVWYYLGSATNTSSQSITATSATALPTGGGLNCTVTIPSDINKVKLTLTARNTNSPPSNAMIISIWRGAIGSGTQVSESKIGTSTSATATEPLTVIALDGPSAGSVTYNVAAYVTANTGGIDAVTAMPITLLVEGC